METLKTRGDDRRPFEGPMACNEFSVGRLAEPEDILAALADAFAFPVLNGLKALVTSGPTHEPIDPVRYIANRSSGKQGHAIARALRKLGAETTLVSGRRGNRIGGRARYRHGNGPANAERLRDGPALDIAARRRRGRLAGYRQSPSKLKKGAWGERRRSLSPRTPIS